MSWLWRRSLWPWELRRTLLELTVVFGPGPVGSQAQAPWTEVVETKQEQTEQHAVNSSQDGRAKGAEVHL